MFFSSSSRVSVSFSKYLTTGQHSAYLHTHTHTHIAFDNQSKKSCLTELASLSSILVAYLFISFALTTLKKNGICLAAVRSVCRFIFALIPSSLLNFVVFPVFRDWWCICFGLVRFGSVQFIMHEYLELWKKRREGVHRRSKYEKKV